MTKIEGLRETNIFTQQDKQNQKVKNPKEIVIPLVPQEEIKEEIISWEQYMEENNKKLREWSESTLENIFPEIKEYKRKLEIEKIIKLQTNKVKLNLSKEDIAYWTQIIKENGETTDIRAELLAAIICKESKFSKHINSATGSGAMQVTTITIQDMFSDTNGGRLKLYNLIDEETMNKILYKQTPEGEIEKDNNGKNIRTYNTPSELREACGKDDNLGVQVGIMCLKMKFAEIVAKKKGLSIEATIKGLKNHELKLSSKEIETILETTLKRYNSVFQSYGKEVVDSLKINDNLNFEEYNLIK